MQVLNSNRRPPLDAAANAADSLRFWLRKYLAYKAMTLGNHRADREKLEEALSRLDVLEDPSIEALRKIANEIRRAGVGVTTQFVPAAAFVEWLSRNRPPRSIMEIDDEVAIRFLTSATAGKSDATRVNYKNALGDFFTYASRHNRERHLIDVDLKRWQRNASKGSVKTPEHLNPEEIDRFLDAVDRHDYGGKRTSDEAAEYRAALYPLLFRLLLLTGIRISEALSLETKSLTVEGETGILTVWGKGNKTRKVPFPYRCSDGSSFYCIEPYLKRYMRVRACPKGVRLLFCDYDGKPLYTRKVSLVLSSILKEAGIHKEKTGPHLLRHTYATLLYARTKDLRLVQEILGHESSRVTERYTHIGEEERRKAAAIFREDDDEGLHISEVPGILSR